MDRARETGSAFCAGGARASPWRKSQARSTSLRTRTTTAIRADSSAAPQEFGIRSTRLPGDRTQFSTARPAARHCIRAPPQNICPSQGALTPRHHHTRPAQQDRRPTHDGSTTTPARRHAGRVHRRFRGEAGNPRPPTRRWTDRRSLVPRLRTAWRICREHLLGPGRKNRKGIRPALQQLARRALRGAIFAREQRPPDAQARLLWNNLSTTKERVLKDSVRLTIGFPAISSERRRQICCRSCSCCRRSRRRRRLLRPGLSAEPGSGPGIRSSHASSRCAAAATGRLNVAGLTFLSDVAAE